MLPSRLGGVIEAVPSQRAKASQDRRARVRREIGQVRFGDRLTRERLRREREGLRRPRLLAGQVRRGHRSLLDREERFPGCPVEHEDEGALRDLRDRIDACAVAGDGDEVGSGGEIAIPQIVMHGLEMPEAPAARGVESEERVREQVGANAAAAVEVRRRRTSGDVDDAARGVHAHSRPRVCASRGLPRVGRPRVVTELARTRDRVEGPANRARAHVVRAHVTRRRPFLFADARPLNEEILVDHAGARCANHCVADVAAQSGGEVHPSRIAERAVPDGPISHRARRGVARRQRRCARRDHRPIRATPRFTCDSRARFANGSNRQISVPLSARSATTASAGVVV